MVLEKGPSGGHARRAAVGNDGAKPLQAGRGRGVHDTRTTERRFALRSPTAPRNGVAPLRFAFMGPDDEICLCFHVTRRKVENFLRIERPRRAGQLSECFGAGTGCGWCRPFLKRLFDRAAEGGLGEAEAPCAEQYAQMRRQYIRQRGVLPPDIPNDANP